MSILQKCRRPLGVASALIHARERAMATQKHASEGQQNPFWFNNAAITDKGFAESMKRTQSAFEDGFRTLSDETLHFVRERLDHCSEAIEKCRECKDVPSLLAVPQKWFADMTRDYYEESMRMGDLMRKVFADGFVTEEGQRPSAQSHANGDTA